MSEQGDIFGANQPSSLEWALPIHSLYITNNNEVYVFEKAWCFTRNYERILILLISFSPSTHNLIVFPCS